MTRTYEIKNSPEQMVEEMASQVENIRSIVDYAAGANMSSLVSATKGLGRKLGSMAEPNLLSQLVNATDLDSMTFDPLTEHVPGLVVEGFTLLCGAPKAGKSWLGGDIACGCASGGMVLGKIPVEARPVFLVSLEDSKRRLQSRLQKIMRGQPLPKNLDVLTEAHSKVMLATITEWMQRHHDSAPLVILDTLGKARQSASSNGNQYQEDYGFAGSIKAVVDEVPGAALVAVHHTRKQVAEDFLDTVSGTQGIAGAADSVIVLSRKRKSDEGVLSVTGRDIEENEYAVRTDGGLWSLDGMDILDAAATVNARREHTAESKLGSRSLDAMTFVNSRSSTSPADLAKQLSIDGKAAGDLLADLHKRGYIDKPSRGLYAPMHSESAESAESAGQRLVAPPANSGDSALSGHNVTSLFTNTPPERQHP